MWIRTTSPNSTKFGIWIDIDIGWIEIEILNLEWGSLILCGIDETEGSRNVSVPNYKNGLNIVSFEIMWTEKGKTFKFGMKNKCRVDIKTWFWKYLLNGKKNAKSYLIW